jgi:hypothetical protein
MLSTQAGRPGPRTRTPDDGLELIVAPVTITPTKPLTPTHVKGLLWTDVLVKASAQIADVRLVWNPRMSNLTTQTIAFWDYLDRTEPETDWSGESEAGIGGRYVRFHQGNPLVRPRDLDPYFERIEHAGWMHPAARRMLGLWRAQFDLLHVPDPGLTDPRPLAWSAEVALDALARRRLIVDHRRFGGPVYLDGARWGMPIRQLVGTDRHANYLLPVLRELLPMVRPGRLFLLLFDDGLASDYALLERVLTEFGAVSTRLSLSRVPIDGTARSSRYGGWTGSTLADISATSGSADADAYRLGMRMYFVGLLDRRSTQSFRMDLVRRCVGRAARILAQNRDAADDASEQHLRLLVSLSRAGGYVDPRRLTMSLFGRRPVPLHPALQAIYG